MQRECVKLQLYRARFFGHKVGVKRRR
jgi:hypothetical protein